MRRLIEPVCQASLLRAGPSGDTAVDCLLFSNPASVKRERMTVRLSADGGKSWPLAQVLHVGPAAYSCLTMLADGTVGCLFESGAHRAYETITLARFDLGWLKERG